MLKKASYLLPFVLLGACAYAIDGAVQDVKFVSPGANGAACNVFVEGLKHKVKPPQTLNLFKSKEDLVVDCMAPGNRRKVVYIKPQIESSTAWNAANAGIGLPWDYASAAMYRYPDIIEVNFTDTPVKDPAPPAQNNPDIRQPENYILEEFSPSSPQLNRDRDAPPVEILRRGESASSGFDSMNDTAAFSEPAMNSNSGKGDLMSVIEGLGGDGSSSGDNAGTPVPLIPGE